MKGQNYLMHEGLRCVLGNLPLLHEHPNHKAGSPICTCSFSLAQELLYYSLQQLHKENIAQRYGITTRDESLQGRRKDIEANVVTIKLLYRGRAQPTPVFEKNRVTPPYFFFFKGKTQ